MSLRDAGSRLRFSAASLLLCATAFALITSGNAQSRQAPTLVEYLSETNATTYSYFWLALQAGHLDEYLNDSSLTLTVFAPTNAAWIKRLPTLTTANGITVQQLFSESKSAALQSLLQYHILNTPKGTSSFKNGDYLGTLSNLCSDAKTLSVEVEGSNITLLGAGGTKPRLLDRGLLVGTAPSRSIVYPIDDVLIPSVVTIPLEDALKNFNQTNRTPYSPTISRQTSTLDELQRLTENEAPAPVYHAPATPPISGSRGAPVEDGTTG